MFFCLSLVFLVNGNGLGATAEIIQITEEDNQECSMKINLLTENVALVWLSQEQ